MLTVLKITNFALIEQADVAFEPGLNVMTGETGAGKTIVLSALNLLLGQRADPALIGLRGDEALVEAALKTNEAETILARSVSKSGKNKASINGNLANAGMLADYAGGLIDFHGQHEHQALLSVATHIKYLDGYGGKTENDAVKSYGEAFAAFREKEKELEAAVLRDREAVERADLTAFQVAEIERADLVEGEDEVLEREILVMKSSERIAGAAQAALDALRGGDDQMGGVSAMEAASAELTALAAIDKTMKEQAERLRGVSAEADDIARSIQSYRQDIEYDKNRLDEASTRLELIKTMKRKYGDSISQILRFKDTAKSELAAQEASDENIKRLKASIQKSEAELHGMADSLTAARRRAAAELEKTVERELEGLNLKGCRFKVGFGDTLDLTANGKDRIEFLLSPNPGQGLMPLAKTASGGEISRIMLALKIAFIKADPVPVLVFDEIDSGIGGETAAAVGRKLKQLAGNHQVICITHLPQIAAYGDAHFFVSKTEKSGTALTGISRLDEKGRIDELSRMLTGGASTEASSRQHAKELLSAARAVSAVE